MGPAAIGPEASPAARSVIAGKPISGCLAWKPRAIGRIFNNTRVRVIVPLLSTRAVAVLREGRRGGDKQPL